MANKDLTLEIDESSPKYAIDKLKFRSQEWYNLWTKKILMYDSYLRYWKPRIDMGKKCYEYRKRRIFTYAQRLKYQNVYNKIPIEPQEIKGVINSLLKLIGDMVQTSMVTMEDETPPENAASPEVMNVVLKDTIEHHEIESKKDQVLEDGLHTGFPCWIWYDLVRREGEISKELDASPSPWDGTLSTPHFQKKDGKDIADVFRLAVKTKQQMLGQYPNRKKALKQHEEFLEHDPGYVRELLHTDNIETADERSTLLYRAMQRAQFDGMNGHFTVVEHVFPVIKEQTVYINEETEDVVMLPPQWDKQRKKLWVESHPEYDIDYKRKIKTLWVTTVSTDGFIWENAEHWYQYNGELPGVPLIVDSVDREPIGAVEDMLPYVLGIAVSETEGLDDVRKGTARLTKVEEGSIGMSHKNLRKELAKDEAVVVIKKSAKSGMDSVKTEQRKPNDTYMSYADRQRGQLSNMHKINDSMQGITHPRQSDVAKDREISQGEGPQLPYAKSYSKFDLDNTQKICTMIPYFMSERKIIEIKDEYGEQMQPLEVNAPGFDYSGAASIVANDITSCKYRIIPVPSEDTPTSRERDLKEFVSLLEALGNTLFQMDPRLVANIFRGWPNRYARDAGTSLEEFANQNAQQQQAMQQQEMQIDLMKEKGRREVDMAKIFAPKWNFKMDPEDIAASPQGTQVMFEYFEKFKQQAAAAGQASQGQAQPAPQQSAPAPVAA